MANKKITIRFLQVVTVLVGVVVLVAMIRLPLIEGRAVGLSLFEVYADPFIFYAYIASIPFFVGIYQVSRLLGYVQHGTVSSSASMNIRASLNVIRYSAVAFAALVIVAGFYVRTFHSEGDDPAGFLALCGAATLVAVVISIAAGIGERKLKKTL